MLLSGERTHRRFFLGPAMEARAAASKYSCPNTVIYVARESFAVRIQLANVVAAWYAWVKFLPIGN